MVDWTEIERRNAGTPPWWVLAVSIRGTTPTTYRAVFAAVDVDLNSEEPVRILIAAEYGVAEAEVITSWEINLRIQRAGVSKYRILGETREELITTAVGPRTGDA